MRSRWYVCVIAAALCVGGPVAAQEGRGQERPQERVVPLMVSVVLTRHPQAKPETVTARLPFEVGLTAGNRATLHVKGDVPVPAPMVVSGDGKTTAVSSYNFRSVGTSLTIDATDVGDGRYRLQLAIDDSQLVPVSVSESAAPGLPRALAQSFQASTSVVMGHGDRVQHSLATDKITGEQIRIEIGLKVGR